MPTLKKVREATLLWSDTFEIFAIKLQYKYFQRTKEISRFLLPSYLCFKMCIDDILYHPNLYSLMPVRKKACIIFMDIALLPNYL